MPTLAKFFRLAFLISMISSLLIFMFFPTATVQGFFSAMGKNIKGFYGLSLFLSSLAAAVCYMLYKVFGADHQRNVTRQFGLMLHDYGRAMAIFQAVASMAIFAQLVHNLHGPLTWDENTIGAALTTLRFGDVITLIGSGAPDATSTNHPIAMIASFISLKIFGIHETSLRLPSLFFAVLFLILLYFFSRRFFSGIAIVIIYTHLAVSGPVLWYLQSSRGYSSMMFFALIPLWMVLDLVYYRTKRWSFRTFAVFGIGLVLTICTNATGAIFCFILFLGLLLWLYLNLGDLDRETLARGRVFLIVELALLPLVVLSAGFEVMIQAGYSHFFEADNGGALQIVGAPLGYTRIWATKILILWIAGVVFFRMTNRGTSRLDFLSLLLGTGALFLISVSILMGINYHPSRYFLAYLVPCLGWLAESISRVPAKLRKTAVGSLFVLVGLVPLLFLRDFYHSETGNNQGFHVFMQAIRTNTKGQGTCIEIEGIDPEARWAKSVYFPLTGARPDCNHRFLVLLGNVHNRTPNATFHEVLRDPAGRVLYEIAEHGR